MSNQYLGIATIKVNGKVLETKPGATLDVGGMNRAAVIHDQGVGFSEARAPAVLECQIVVGRDTSLAELRDIKNATVVYQADTGQTWIIGRAWCAGTPKLTGSDGGSVALTFNGDPAEEVR